MAQIYIPRYDSGGGNPWAGAASAYGNELDRLGALQQQGMQDTSQLPMKLYQSFLQGYQDRQERTRLEAEMKMKQDQIDRQNRLADIQQQKNDEAEAFRREQLRQKGVFEGTKLLGETQQKIAQDYDAPMRGSFKTQIKAALMAKGMGETEADAASEAYLPALTETKYESKVHAEPTGLEETPDQWQFKIGDQPVSVGQEAEPAAPADWSFSPGTVAEDQYRGSRIVEARRKEIKDALSAQQFEEQQAMKEKAQEFKERQLAQQFNIAMAKMGSTAGRAATKEDLKRESEKQADLTKSDALNATMDRLGNTAKEIFDNPKLKDITGPVGKLRGMIPGTDGYDLYQRLKTLTAQTVISEIMNMKSQSKTGATGFGQLSGPEGEWLKTSLANLENAQSYEGLRKNLQEIMNYVENVKKRNAASLARKYGGEVPGAGEKGGIEEERKKALHAVDVATTDERKQRIRTLFKEKTGEDL